MRAPCRGKVHKCAPSPAKITRALSKGMADPVRARMTRSLHWAKETTFTSNEHSGDAQDQIMTNILLEHVAASGCAKGFDEGQL